MDQKAVVKLIFLDLKGDGLLHLPPPHPPFKISKKIVSQSSPFLGELYETSRGVYLSRSDDPVAVMILLKIFHGVDPQVPVELITPVNVARIAALSLKWKCTQNLGTYPSLWLSILEKRGGGEHEPWIYWLKIGKAFGTEDIINSIVVKHGSTMWRDSGYDELESLKFAVHNEIIGM